MKQIIPNKWYRFECKAARDQFISIALGIDSLEVFGCIPDEVFNAQALKYNSKTQTLNYRTKIREDYYYLYELYTYQNEMEEIKMEPRHCQMGIDPCCVGFNNPILDNYHRKNREAIKAKYQAEREQIIETSVVGKAAKNYINALMLVKPFSVMPELQSLVPFETLSDAEQRHIRRANEQEDAEIKALQDKIDEVRYLLSITDTFEQKEKLFKKYGMLDTEAKTTTDKIKKSK